MQLYITVINIKKTLTNCEFTVNQCVTFIFYFYTSNKDNNE
jgi:hypothetical protein